MEKHSKDLTVSITSDQILKTGERRSEKHPNLRHLHLYLLNKRVCGETEDTALLCGDTRLT